MSIYTRLQFQHYLGKYSTSLLRLHHEYVSKQLRERGEEHLFRFVARGRVTRDCTTWFMENQEVKGMPMLEQGAYCTLWGFWKLEDAIMFVLAVGTEDDAKI